MKPIYVLTSFNIQSKYYNEKQYFTSKTKALKSMVNLREYLIWNHKLDVSNVEIFGTTDSHQFSVILDNKYNVTLTKFYIGTKVLTYK